MDRCIETIPQNIMKQYAEYLQAALEPVDFMPYSGHFLVSRTEENIQKNKQEMRPAYSRLYQLVRERLARLEE